MDIAQYDWLARGRMKVDTIYDIMPELRSIFTRAPRAPKDPLMEILFGRVKERRKKAKARAKSKATNGKKSKSAEDMGDCPEPDTDAGEPESVLDAGEDHSDPEGETAGDDAGGEDLGGEDFGGSSPGAGGSGGGLVAGGHADDMDDLTDDPPPGDLLVWEEVAETTGLPRYDEETFQVHDPESGDIIGRIKPANPCSKKASTSCYCRLHKCQPPLRPLSRARPTHDYLEWFRRGMTIPPGTTAKIEHMRIWDTMGM